MCKKMNKSEEKILVTKPYLPPLKEFNILLEDIWKTKSLTNRGKYHQKFETELSKHLNVPYVSLFSNGTLALLTALQTKKISGEVITTPYSFVATSHALWWNNLRPVYVDINRKTYTLDPNKIESAITQQTTAILPVHVYGTPCDVYKLQEIADTYGLALIYDAAHAFGVQIDGNSVLNFGDMSILSFHATKAFNTFEGGAIICHDASTKKRIDYLKNFGFAGETTVVAPGINAKMNEFQSALGLLQLKYIDQVIYKRKTLSEKYQTLLSKTPGIRTLLRAKNIKHNYSYFPIFVDQKKYGRTRDELYYHLKKYNYYGRRYFYPLISTFNMYRSIPSAAPKNLKNSTLASDEVICLPIYPDLDVKHIVNISTIINEFQKNKP